MEGWLTDNGRLSEPEPSGLVHSLVCEGARARHDTNPAWGVDVPGRGQVLNVAAPCCRATTERPIMSVLVCHPGMMPILHSPGLMMPGQLGPAKRKSERRSAKVATTVLPWVHMLLLMLHWILSVQQHRTYEGCTDEPGVATLHVVLSHHHVLTSKH